jgi:hypothetical protein
MRRRTCSASRWNTRLTLLCEYWTGAGALVPLNTAFLLAIRAYFSYSVGKELLGLLEVQRADDSPPCVLEERRELAVRRRATSSVKAFCWISRSKAVGQA